MNRKILLNRMRHNPFFIVGCIGVAVIVLFCIFGPMLISHDPLKNSLTERFIAPEGFSKGLDGHVLGTDHLGRDVFIRLLYGGRYSLFIAIITVLIQVIIGGSLGVIAGYFGGKIDAVIMRACDVMLAIPQLILAIAVVGVLGSSISNLIAVLAVSGWMQCCRVTRNNVMVVKKQEFVHASKTLGATSYHIMFKQILINVTTSIVIMASQRIGLTVLFEAALSFLSLGIQPPTPSWGNMISQGRSYLTTFPWMVFVPGVTMMITILSFNLLGDGLRDVLDPKQTK